MVKSFHFPGLWGTSKPKQQDQSASASSPVTPVPEVVHNEMTIPAPPGGATSHYHQSAIIDSINPAQQAKPNHYNPPDLFAGMSLSFAP